PGTDADPAAASFLAVRSNLPIYRESAGSRDLQRPTPRAARRAHTAGAAGTTAKKGNQGAISQHRAAAASHLARWARRAGAPRGAAAGPPSAASGRGAVSAIASQDDA